MGLREDERGGKGPGVLRSPSGNRLRAIGDVAVLDERAMGDRIICQPPHSKMTKVSQEASDHIIECDMPFDPLRMKGPPRSGKKKRKTDSNDENNEGQGGSGAGPSRPADPFEQMEEQLSAMREGVVTSLPQTHVKLQEDLENEKQKWKDAQEFSFLGSFVEEESNDGSDEASS
ncbi:hypothetical protein HAX54_021245 [Datura stramonium]|uniref:Uncharacterized protein n=1 Tax=Datura stramonium TaxID=4076 RepID=A0ABS8UUC5_DATST|nr:hypothetical protein [Datura stramonium]